jgi:RecB family exonuclease
VSWLGPAFVGDLASLVAAQEGAPAGVATHPAEPGVRVGWMINRPEHVGTVLRDDGLAPAPPRTGEDAEEPSLALEPAEAVAPVAPAALSYSTLQRYQRCGYRFYLEDGLRLPAGAESGAPAGGGERGGLPANVRGSIVHTLLERAGAREPSEAELDAAAAEHGARLGPDDRADVRGLLEGFRRSDLAARVDEARREERFAFVFDGLVVLGAFDAFVRDGERALVVDYKTNRLEGRRPGEVVEAEYAVQRLVYALAALRDGAREVEVTFAFLEVPDEPVAARFSAADAGRLEGELRALTAGLSAQRFPVAAEPNRELCHGCPGRGSLCSWPREATERDPSNAPLSTAALPAPRAPAAPR